MKRFISQLSLYLYASRKNALAAIFLMAAFRIGWSVMHSAGKVNMEITGGFFYPFLRFFSYYVFTFFLLFLFISLGNSDLTKRGKGAYTLERAGMSRAGRYWTNAAANLIYFCLYWTVGGVVTAVQLLIENPSYPGPQGTYLDIISDLSKTVTLPLNNTTLLISVPMIILVFALVSARTHQNRLNAQTDEDEG